ncbi:hypothetical protein JS533_009070 [Bifidobacterium amazonense]|uniref:Uncharacterized protein n=1 Tax=Bifidobacterium amazonense TaxID=2809027 RepID=A0ABS9VWD2_9BIFI|nr:hypothetical protein [Bifidobacterium amazonense]MCH9276415.1 hypothetical protein [Bifidobacterium amazonense]
MELSQLAGVADKLETARLKATNEALEHECKRLTRELDRYRRKLKAERAVSKRCKRKLDTLNQTNNDHERNTIMADDDTTAEPTGIIGKLGDIALAIRTYDAHRPDFAMAESLKDIDRQLKRIADRLDRTGTGQ